MSVKFNPNTNRFDIPGVQDPGLISNKQQGINGYKSVPGKLYGKILKASGRAISVKTDEGKVYLSTKSIKNYYARVITQRPDLQRNIDWKNPAEVKQFVLDCSRLDNQAQQNQEAEVPEAKAQDVPVPLDEVLEGVSKTREQILKDKSVLLESPAISTKRKEESLEDLSNRIYQNREQMYKDSGGNAEVLLAKIEEDLNQNGQSLDKIMEDPKALEIFMKSSILRKTLAVYAARTDNETFKNKHLNVLIDDIKKNLDHFTAVAIANATASDGNVDVKRMMINLTSIIMQRFEAEGRSLQEILDNPDIKLKFEQRDRLRVVLDLYQKINGFEPQREKEEVIAAKKQALQDKEKGIGLMTEFGLKEVPKDQLKGKMRGLALQNHPDRGGSPEKMQRVNELKELINNEMVAEYQKALDAFRKR